MDLDVPVRYFVQVPFFFPMETSLFAHVALTQSGTYTDPEAPSVKHVFAAPNVLEACITLLLPQAESVGVIAALPERLHDAAQLLEGDVSVSRADRALKEIAEGFENYLQLIASVKYARQPDVLHGSKAHRGVLGTSLGGLLLGRLAKRHDRVPDGDVPAVKVVTYVQEGKDLRNRVYNAARVIRNDVHKAERTDAAKVFRDVQTVMAAYLFATEENQKLIGAALHPQAAILREAFARLGNHTDFVIEPSLEALAPEGETPVRMGYAGIKAMIVEGAEWVGIFGAPGAGKSTLSRELALQLGADKQRDPFGRSPLPILVEANRYTPTTSLRSLVAGELGIAPDDLESYAAGTHLALFLDGLNEVQTQFLRAALVEARNLQEIPSLSVVVTSRFERLFRGLGARHMRLAPFDDEQVKAYLGRALGAEAGAFFEDLQSHPRLLDLCRTPLLLYMLVDTSAGRLRVPPNRGRLLDAFVNRFLDRETESDATLVQARTLSRLLAHVGYEMRSRRAVALPQAEVEKIVESYLPTLQSGVGVFDVMRVLTEARLLYDVGGGSLSFFHELVQEYFAALELRRLYAQGAVDLGALVDDAWWAEVVVLFYGLIEEGEEALFQEIQRRDVALSARCVMDAPSPEPSRTKAVVDQASEILDQGGADQTGALAALAEVWDERALERAAASLGTHKKIFDFVVRFKENPVEAALALLRASPTSVVARGVEPLLRGAGARPGQASALGDFLVDLVQRKTSGESIDLEYSQIVKLAKWGRADDASAVRAVEAVLETGDALPALRLLQAFDLKRSDVLYAVGCRLISQKPPREGFRFPVDRLDEGHRRGLLMQAVVLRDGAWISDLARGKDDREWLGPVLADIGAGLLRAGASGYDTWKALVALGGAEQAQASVVALVRTRSLGPHGAAQVWTELDDLTHRSVRPALLRAAAGYDDEADLWIRIAQSASAGEVDEGLGRAAYARFATEDRPDAALVAVWASGLEDRRDAAVARAAQVLSNPRFLDNQPSGRLAYGFAYTWWPPNLQETLIARASAGSATHALHAWCEEAVEALRQRLSQKLALGKLGSAAALYRRVGLEAQALEVAARITMEALGRSAAEAVDLVQQWGLSPKSIPLSCEDAAALRDEVSGRIVAALESGARSSKQLREWAEAWDVGSIWDRIEHKPHSSATLAGGYKLGLVPLHALESWLLEQSRAGDILGALSILESGAADELGGAATLAVMEALEADRLVHAGQLIAAFRLRDEFAPEIGDLLPQLIREGRTGIASTLLESLGPEAAAPFGGLVLREACRSVEQGAFNQAVALVDTAGVSFVASEFSVWLEAWVHSRVRDHDADRLQALALSLLVGHLSHSALDSVVEHAVGRSIWFSARAMRVFEDRHYALVKVGRVKAFMHGSVVGEGFADVASGKPLNVRLAKVPKGYSVTDLQILKPLDGGEPPEPFPQTDGPGVTDVGTLADRWGARVGSI